MDTPCRSGASTKFRAAHDPRASGANAGRTLFIWGDTSVKSYCHALVRWPAILLMALCWMLAACSGKDHAQITAHGTVAPTEGAPSDIRKATGLAAFGQVIPPVLTNFQCALDAVNGTPPDSLPAVAVGSAVTFGGWAGDGNGQAARQFDLAFVGARTSYSTAVDTGVERPDVAKALNSKSMAKAGFNLVVQLTGVVPDTYSLYVVNPADPTADCDLHRTLTVQ